jgi:cytochrome b6-f complex iron-sulfur subunit
MERPADTPGEDELLRIGLSRRAWIKLSLAAAGVLALAGLRRFLSYEEAPARPTKAVLGAALTYPVNSLTAVPELNCWLARDESGFYALSSVCSHLGCLVQPQGEGFSCPCHGSRFTQEGALVNGPALKPLQQVQVGQTADGRLEIDAGVTVAPGVRLAA